MPGRRGIVALDDESSGRGRFVHKNSKNNGRLARLGRAAVGWADQTTSLATRVCLEDVRQTIDRGWLPCYPRVDVTGQRHARVCVPRLPPCRVHAEYRGRVGHIGSP